jgi:tetratricopeptide (TPR) repeat protein
MPTLGLSYVGWRTAGVLLAALFAFSPVALAQDETTDVTQPPLSSAAKLVELNRGIRAYLEADYERARGILERLLAQDEDNAACLYYLGLIYLDEGLDLSSVDSAAARAKFDLARQRFERVTRLADPTVAPVEAALLLGIAQLAADVPAEAGVVAELALRAQETLQRYVRDVDVGKNDRYGYFYLGVAHYRLGDHYAKSEKYLQASEQLDAAVEALKTAQVLAEVDRKRGETTPEAPRALDEEKFWRFERVVSYYRGLIALQRQQNREARRLLEYVREHDRSELRENAAGILEKLDQMEVEYPLPFSFATPLGRLDFEGGISIGGAYDTNVILLGKDTALPLGIGQKYDFRLETEAAFSVYRYISKTEAPVGESLSIGLGGRTAHAWQPRIDEFDINIYAGQAFAQWQPLRDFYLGLQYEYSYTQLGHDPFISSNRLTPVVSKIWRARSGGGTGAGDELGRTDVWYNYDYRNYLERIGDPRFNRDGKYHAVGVRHTFNLMRASELWPSYYAAHEGERRLFGGRWLNLSLGYVYRDERTRGSEFDLAGHSILAGVEFPLPYRLAFEFESVLTWEDYASPSVFDYRRNERFDFVQRYDFGLTHTFVARGEASRLPTLEVKLRAGVAVTFQNSNIWDRLSQDIYEYDRAVYGVKLSINF